MTIGWKSVCGTGMLSAGGEESRGRLVFVGGGVDLISACDVGLEIRDAPMIGLVVGHTEPCWIFPKRAGPIVKDKICSEKTIE